MSDQIDNSVRGINGPAVTAWLDANIDGVKGPYDFGFITGGHSNLTYRVVDSNSRAIVLRRPPLGAVLATAHDMEREHRIVAAINKTSVPVPAALGLCTDESINDAPFYIMDFVDGVVMHDDETSAVEMPDEAMRDTLSISVADVLARLHLVNPDDIGLGELGRKEAYLDRQLKRWNTQWEGAKTRELPQMEEAYAGLLSAKPEQRYTGIVHGDYRLGNMLVDPAKGSIQGVLDWELCTLGDVLADIGYLLNNWVEVGEEPARGATSYPTAIPGFKTREAVVERYVEKTGFEVGNVDYYRAFQHWRLAAIVEGVLARYLKGVMGDGEVDLESYAQQVESMADEALRLLS